MSLLKFRNCQDISCKWYTGTLILWYAGTLGTLVRWYAWYAGTLVERKRHGDDPVHVEGNHLHCGGLVLVDQVSELSWVRGHPHQGFRGWLARLLPLTVEEDELVGDGIHTEHHVTALLAHFVKRNWRRSISIEATISLSEYQLVLQEQTPAKVSFISFNLPY